jgi:hypothetical protein
MSTQSVNLGSGNFSKSEYSDFSKVNTKLMRYQVNKVVDYVSVLPANDPFCNKSFDELDDDELTFLAENNPKLKEVMSKEPTAEVFEELQKLVEEHLELYKKNKEKALDIVAYVNGETPKIDMMEAQITQLKRKHAKPSLIHQAENALNDLRSHLNNKFLIFSGLCSQVFTVFSAKHPTIFKKIMLGEDIRQFFMMLDNIETAQKRVEEQGPTPSPHGVDAEYVKLDNQFHKFNAEQHLMNSLTEEERKRVKEHWEKVDH